ncbi:hypothetical protein DFJ77DRAFT_454403 [Powellomyces hirtus]|nr:hypothetical protein DFJ77DRAFT_454403 [Powellomyces hirtus]
MSYIPQRITSNADGTLTIHDGIYGDAIHISDPVLVHLINSTAVQRLAHVLQHGITGLLGMTPPVTRLEHSVGAMLLVRRLGAELKEQIASLLHDISHTALSHVVDHAFKGSASYHELHKEAYLQTTDVGPILARFGYDWRDFVEEKGYPLLEQDAPKLCADRVDYGLRDCLAFGHLTTHQVAAIVNALVVVNNCIVCRDPRTARMFAEAYMEADSRVWSNAQHTALYELAGTAIRTAVEKGYITTKNLWLHDQDFWAGLVAAGPHHHDQEFIDTLALVSPNTHFAKVAADENPDLSFRPKARTIDPGVRVGDHQVQPLSDLDSEYREIRRAYMESKAIVLHLRVV